jgi:NitT/TauT family transport system ATP-binding protein
MDQMAAAHGTTAGEIDVRNVTKVYGAELGVAVTAVKDCSFIVERGKFTVLIGPSGCGKTTLIDLMAGYEAPTSGKILLDGAPVTGPGQDRLVVFQESALFPWMTTINNVMYGPLVQRERRHDEIERDAIALLDRVGLSDFRDKYPIQLSGGMQRRAELARALINNPKVLLMDEPFRGLDAMTRELMQEYLLKLFEGERRTIVFVTSEIDEAIFLADTLLVLGRPPADVKARITIDLPRPRTFEMLTSKRYAEFKDKALGILYEEAVSAFTTGTQQAADMVEAYEKRRAGQ